MPEIRGFSDLYGFLDYILSYLMLSFAFSFVIEIVIKEKSSCSLSDRGDFLILGMYIDFLCSLY